MNAEVVCDKSNNHKACVCKCYLCMFFGLQIEYRPVNWEVLCHKGGWRVGGGGCRRAAAVNLPSLRKHTCNLSDLPVADRERGVCVCLCVGGWLRRGRGESWLTLHAKVGGGAADRYKDKGTLSERESSWKMADSFLVQEKGSHWSGGDGVPSQCPSWSWRPSSPKGHPPLPHLSTPQHTLSQLSNCHSLVCSSVPPILVSLHQLSLSKTLTTTVLLFSLSVEQQQYCTLI